MYISLKWKLVVFLSLVLVAMTATWTWQSISKQLDTFEEKLEQTHTDQNTLLSELISDSYLKLSQFGQLIAEKQIVLHSLAEADPGEELKQSLEREWLVYNINLGLDYLAVFDSDNQMRLEASYPELNRDLHFRGILKQQLASRESPQKPHNFTYCATACLMVVLEPFINEAGKTGTIALAQNMADVVRVYFNFSRAGLGILVADEAVGNTADPQRFLKNWNVSAWAVSDFNTIFPVLKGRSTQMPIGENGGNELYHHGQGVYLIKQLTLPDLRTLGNPVYFVSVNDETADYQLMRSNIKRGAAIGFLGLLGAETILLLLLIAPMNKLLNITRALHLLPHQEFSKAAGKVRARKTLFPDELSTLEESTAFVARELEKLHIEINLKNESLEEQIHALTRSRSFLTRLFDSAQIFILTQDYEFNVLSTNRKFDSLYNHTPKTFDVLFSSESDLDEFRQSTHRLKSGDIEVFQQEIRQIDKDANELVITWTHALVENERGEEIILSIGMDQTLQKKAERDLRWMANHDSLTGLGNRRYFNAAFNQCLNSDQRGALVFIDINRFKQINDIYGHSSGDQVLVEISQKLRSLLRSSDVICRFAGDEFTAILTNVDAGAVPTLLDKIAAELNGSLKIASGRVISYSVSIGASVFPDHGIDAQSLVINADMAMYNAKRKGLGHWHLFDARDEQIVQLKQDHNLILSIKNALKNGDFTLVYQPVLDLHDSSISHYEVLVRMYDESGEIVSPALFIPVAERSGEIRRIDEWVLDNALLELSKRVECGKDFAFAVNISAPTMQADDFPQMVFDAIARHRLDPKRLIIELTETAYIENFQQVLKNLKQITTRGVKVALDDFGVGFSSFTYLKMLPLSYVKLDGSYIQDLSHNPDDQVFVSSLAAIINAFGMETIAEFVEDEATLQLLLSLGVTHGQGYHIGRPGPIVALNEDANADSSPRSRHGA